MSTRLPLMSATFSILLLGGCALIAVAVLAALVTLLRSAAVGR